MEARRHELVLADGDDGAVVAELGHLVVGRDLREDLNAVAHLGHRRRANEVRLVAAVGGAIGDLHRTESRLGLAAEGVALDGDVEAAEERLRGTVIEVLRQQDQARAHAPRGLALHELLQRLQQLGVDEAVPDGGALAARKNDRVHSCELLGSAHLDALDALVARKRLHVLREATLNGKDANLEGRAGGRMHGGAAGGGGGRARGRGDRVRLDGDGDEQQPSQHQEGLVGDYDTDVSVLFRRLP